MRKTYTSASISPLVSQGPWSLCLLQVTSRPSFPTFMTLCLHTSPWEGRERTVFLSTRRLNQGQPLGIKKLQHFHEEGFLPEISWHKSVYHMSNRFPTPQRWWGPLILYLLNEEGSPERKDGTQKQLAKIALSLARSRKLTIFGDRCIKCASKGYSAQLSPRHYRGAWWLTRDGANLLLI